MSVKLYYVDMAGEVHDSVGDGPDDTVMVTQRDYDALLAKIAELEALLREINHCHCEKCDACCAASCVG